MALSNIRREPRREITETVVGLAAFAAVLVPDYFVSRWFVSVCADPPPLVAAMMLVPLIVGMLAVTRLIVLAMVHATGDGICNALQRRGVHLRPRVRPCGGQR